MLSAARVSRFGQRQNRSGGTQATVMTGLSHRAAADDHSQFAAVARGVPAGSRVPRPNPAKNHHAESRHDQVEVFRLERVGLALAQMKGAVTSSSSSADDTECPEGPLFRCGAVPPALCSKLCSDRDASRHIGRHRTELRLRDIDRKSRVLACFVTTGWDPVRFSKPPPSAARAPHRDEIAKYLRHLGLRGRRCPHDCPRKCPCRGPECVANSSDFGL